MTKIIFDEITYTIGSWALPYLINGDASDLTDAERKEIDEWVDKAYEHRTDADGARWVFSHESVDTDSDYDFGYDEITGLHGPVINVSILFRKADGK
jgi:hypothetical protein